MFGVYPDIFGRGVPVAFPGVVRDSWPSQRAITERSCWSRSIARECRSTCIEMRFLTSVGHCVPALARKNRIGNATRSLTSLPYFTSLLHFLTSLPYLVTSIQCGNRVALLPPPMQIVHRNVQVNVAARRLDADHHRFRLGAAGQPRFVHVNFRRKHFEMKSLIVQQRHGIPDDHVRHLANRLPDHLLARLNFRPRELARHLYRHFRREVENHAPLDVSLDGNERRDTLAAIRLFVHFQVHDFRRRLQRLREDRVRGIDERLNQFHSHERCSPASATGEPTALGSSLSTYRRISYSTSGFTGFCTKCFAPFWRAARIFSWYPTEETMTMRALACWRTMRSTASIPSICGMVMSMSTMSGLIRLNSAMAVRPSPASPATSPPNISIILMRFLRAKTESSTTR